MDRRAFQVHAFVVRAASPSVHRPGASRRGLLAALGKAPQIFLLLTLVVGASCLGPPSAEAVWRERPKGKVVAEFALEADSALIWSIGLPDSAAVGKRYGREVLEAASVRADTVQPKAWARDFARRLFDPRGLDSHCECEPLRRPSDSSAVVAPVVEFRIGDEAMWAFLSFPDTCAILYLEQGTWGKFRLQDPANLLESLHAALPAEPQFASTSLLRPRPKYFPVGLYVYVEELPEAIERVPPVYPPGAIAEGRWGTVLVMALVNVNGRVADTRIQWSVPYLDDAAANAVRRWRFKPAMADGKPVKVWVTVPVRFSLN